MTNLEQLAKDTADLAVTKTIRTEVNGYSVNTAEIASVILAALRSVAEQKDAEAAALRSALEIVRADAHFMNLDWAQEQGYHSLAQVIINLRSKSTAALSTNAGTALLREVESLRAAKSHMESCRALIGARDDETLHDAISDLRERVKKAEGDCARYRSALADIRAHSRDWNMGDTAKAALEGQ